MMHFMVQRENKILFNYEKIIKFSFNIKIVVGTEEKEFNIENNEFYFDISDYKSGTECKLYLQKDETWLYAESLFITKIETHDFSRKIEIFIEELDEKIGDFIYGN